MERRGVGKPRTLCTLDLELVLILIRMPTLNPDSNIADLIMTQSWDRRSSVDHPSETEHLTDCEITKRMIGTAGCWMIFDIIIFGVLTAMPDITEQVLGRGSTASMAISTAGVAFLNIPAGILSIILVRDDALGRKRTQELGFVVNAVGMLTPCRSCHCTSSPSI